MFYILQIYSPQGNNLDTRTLELTFCFSFLQNGLKTKDFLSIFFSFSMENIVLILTPSNTSLISQHALSKSVKTTTSQSPGSYADFHKLKTQWTPSKFKEKIQLSINSCELFILRKTFTSSSWIYFTYNKGKFHDRIR